MTNPNLERAATRVAACLMDGPVDPTFSLAEVNGWTQDKAYEIASAVLMAVREPDEDLDITGAVEYAWPQVFDAILAEGE